ncbi:hypothetical protein [Motilibacter aurantiacus]|uniref:hypothetical protein n=1 Tax=Motilibacter aurantiacus TaxID=2714955 RepID=UPI001409DD64|nr:hypothetical protein [Motilibacter aurantiacus]NHC45245.1 hypothetical protein [Motilibacter aurantiacus]
MLRPSAPATRLVLASAAAALVLSGCGGEPDDAADRAFAAAQVGPTTAATTAPPSSPVASPPLTPTAPATPHAGGTPRTTGPATPRPAKGPTAAQWLSRARAAVQDVGSYQIKGDGYVGSVGYSVSFSAGWDRAQGSVTVDGRKSKVVRIGRTVYFKPEPEFLPLLGIDASKAEALEKKWVSAPVGDERIPVVLDLLDPASSLTVASPKVVARQAYRGVETVEIAGTPASPRVLVAAAGKPLPKAIAPAGGDNPIMVYNYGTGGVTAEAPKGNKVVELSSL